VALPASAGPERPVPALLLLQGGGPTDRDGNQLPGLRSDLLRELAQVLADEGIASLRFDKRGMYANRAGLPAHPDELPKFFSWPSFAGDAQAAFLFLKAYPAVTPDRVGILGHSEGGLLALDLTTRDRPKLLILASTPGRPLGDVIHDQLSALLDRQHAIPAQRRFLLDADQRIRARILASGNVPPDVPAGLAALYPSYLGPFLKSALALDPAALAAGFGGPILVINGAADTQVAATRDAVRFASALAARHDGSEVFTPAGVSHNLKTVTSRDDPGITGSLDAGVKDVILRWLKTAL
jgi:dienelactone hydrolase